MPLTHLLPTKLVESPLALKAALVVEGVITGKHASPFRGFSAEFDQHRAYQHGDDLKYFDWKVYARNEKQFIRQYSDETNLYATLIVDASSSMIFPEFAPKKWEISQILAASFIHLFIKQRDAVGLVISTDHVQEKIQPKGVSWMESHLFSVLEHIVPNGKTNLVPAIESVATSSIRRGMVVVISDFMQPIDDLLPAFRLLASGKHQILAIQILHEQEKKLASVGDILIKDAETNLQMATNFIQIQSDYHQAFIQWQFQLKRSLENLGISFFSCSTQESLPIIFREIIQKSSRKKK